MFKFLKEKLGKALEKISVAIQGKDEGAQQAPSNSEESPNAKTTPLSPTSAPTARSKKDWLAMPKKAAPKPLLTAVPKEDSTIKQVVAENISKESASIEAPQPSVPAVPAILPSPSSSPAVLAVTEKPGFFSRLLGKKQPTSVDSEVPLESLKPVPQAKPPVLSSSTTLPQPQLATPSTIVTAPDSQAKQAVPASSPPLIGDSESPGFFSRVKQAITTTKLTETEFNTLFWDLEVAMLENNVALEAVEQVKGSLRASLVNTPIRRGHVEEEVSVALAGAVRGLFSAAPIDIVTTAKTSSKPFVIALFGVNGSGKTTTIAKLTRLFQNNGLSVVLAASDTFRAAAIDQLQLHADALGVRLVRHDYGSDAAAVAFDAVSHAQAHGKDIVLIDTAGRLHTNTNLMDELRKVVRVAKPQLKLFVGEAITGNDCIEQAKQFNNMVGLDGIVLSKADIDEKGGASVSVSYVTGKPIVLLGTGQGYDDLKVFSPDEIVKQLGLTAG